MKFIPEVTDGTRKKALVPLLTGHKQVTAPPSDRSCSELTLLRVLLEVVHPTARKARTLVFILPCPLLAM